MPWVCARLTEGLVDQMPESRKTLFPLPLFYCLLCFPSLEVGHADAARPGPAPARGRRLGRCRLHTPHAQGSTQSPQCYPSRASLMARLAGAWGGRRSERVSSLPESR